MPKAALPAAKTAKTPRHPKPSTSTRQSSTSTPGRSERYTTPTEQRSEVDPNRTTTVERDASLKRAGNATPTPHAKRLRLAEVYDSDADKDIEEEVKEETSLAVLKTLLNSQDRI